MRIPAVIGLIGLLFGLATGIGTAAAAPVTICGESSDGPPWLYIVKNKDGKETEMLAGFTVDLLNRAFARIGRNVLMRDMPWPRCLQMVEHGEIDFAIGAYYDRERARRFDYSAPYKVLTPQIFYSAQRPVDIKSVKDLARYRGCGMNGSSYAHYGLSEGDLDRGVHSYEALIKKLKLGRCDYFPEELEIIGNLHIGFGRESYLLDPELRHMKIEGALAPALHLVAARGSDAAKLLGEFDTAVAAMQKNGEFQVIWKKHAGDMPF